MSTAPYTLEASPGSEPLVPGPREDVIAALERITALQGLTAAELAWFAEHGVQRVATSGETLFQEGQAAVAMVMLLRGEIHVRREYGGVLPLFIGRSGQLTGLIPFSRMKTYGGIGFAVGDVWALVIHKSLFDDMLRAIPSMAQRSVSVLLDRVREVTRIEQQAEKLNALGKLAGNLAHELNNPASAAQRAASGLLSELRTYGQQKFELGAICLQDSELSAVRAWQDEIRHRAVPADSLAVAEREDTLSRWFSQHQLAQSWQATPDLSELGVEAPDLDRLDSLLKGRGVDVVLRQFASALRAERMTEAMVDATARIFDLIRAVKDYSYMDQAPIQEISIPLGIESTLAMLQSRLNGIEVDQHYAADLPTISAYGSELNQVWMALLENAIDSIATQKQKQGRITVRVTTAGPLLLTEIWDNGPGIPAELRDRVFEPFFTTRPPGVNLGLGLDMVQRVVRKHRGYVRVQSVPGETCFQVRLPIDQLQAY
ncbi:sensor histidine kinase [Acidipila sp. EB88]|uniref:sensor histidine kinase n=1 Tax=Acidipila sp. EB88 TaxID=2305226 RepID=UPI000F600910|nr:ATP-binding protein [Acidipila sp. EB88]RRA48847.1 histidine kinase [Acidipila sp. EB88]